MAEIMFKNVRPNINKLISFGFRKSANNYTYRTDLKGVRMKMIVKVDKEGKLYTNVIDEEGGDEYVLHHIVGVSGEFVGRVKTEYEAVLDEISAQCFDIDVFKSSQANEVMAYIRDTYGDELEYLWKKFPNNAVVRRKDNKKWYAAILTVSRCKLGFDSDEIAEILDLRIDPAKVAETVDNIRYFPGYHMNKKHWITIFLDGTVAINEIFDRIGDSYILAKKVMFNTEFGS